MPSTTPNMGLTRWDLSSDPYDHSQLAANWTALDLHDHSSAKGVQISTGGIANNAITTALIATGAVTTTQILDGTISLADLSHALLDIIQPLGTTLWLWRPAGSVFDLEVSSGGKWVLARGQTLAPVAHNFPGGGSVVIDDLRNCYPLGADLAGTGSIPSTPPAIGALIGAHTANLNHTHTVNAHTHTVAGHSHTVNSHSHNVSAHSHSISSDVANKFLADDASQQAITSRGIATPTGGGFQALYVPGYNSGQVSSASPTNVSHSHTGGTGTATPSTDAQSPGTNSVGLTTDSTAPGTSNPSSDQSAVDKRPQSRGLAAYVKVMY